MTLPFSSSAFYNTCGMAYLLPGRQGEQGKKAYHIPNTSSTQWKALHSVNDFFLFPPWEHSWGTLGDPGAPGETTQKHTHSLNNMFLWQWKALHSVNDFFFLFHPWEHSWGTLGDPGAPAETTQKHTHSLCNMFLWQCTLEIQSYTHS